jgi:pyruvate,orthophosphate dikinase
MLQTRNGKRTGPAAVRIAVDMVEEGMITKKEAILRVAPSQLDQLLHPVFDPKTIKELVLLTRGISASPGAAVGRVAFSAEDAIEMVAHGPVLLVRKETTPDDIHGMDVAKGILTAIGGKSSHAAVVARGMGRPCIVGAGAIRIDEAKKLMTVPVGGKTVTVKAGDFLSLDGTTGEVYLGQAKSVEPDLSHDFIGKFMGWTDEFRGKFGVRANADIPRDAKVARQFGAEGIGLCRTEHMFFAGNRIDAMREMILADTKEERKAALAKILPYQRDDFTGMFKELKGLPATIRFLDPPLHEFLPNEDVAQNDLAAKMGVPVAKIKQRVKELHEFNPMLGFRGCRLGIVYPEISEMQSRAVFEAAADVQKAGIKVKPEVMIPLVGFKKELDLQVEVVHRVAKEVMAEKKVKLDYMVGTMIEVPRGALTADEIAQTAQFFSFGTNDLTQTCLGMSRDDSGSFLGPYQEQEIIKKNPFATIDQDGVGKLMKIAVEKGRATRPDIKLGICGEHGGDPESVKFCHRLGLTYVSCSPFRVPVARLAAAQAALEEEAAKKAKKK